MNKIKKRIKQDYELLVSDGYEVLGVFLQGSQNYELDYEGSDIDTKAVIIPTLDDIILNAKPISTTKILETNEHIDLKDVRLMLQCFKKQNINFVEILFTKYYYLNPKYEQIWRLLISKREDIARYNTYAAINCICGMSYEKYKALEHPYPSLIEKIERYGYDPKQLHHIVRLNEFLKRYIAGETYENCLISNRKEYLLNLKTRAIKLEQARELAKLTDDETKDIKTRYMKENELKINNDVDNLFNAVLLSIFKLSFGIAQ